MTDASASPERHDVVIVGAGAVGLLLACLVAQRGYDVVVLERRATAGHRTRAIGIHPPGLAALDAAGVGEAVRDASVPIRAGAVTCDGRVLGRLDFRGEPVRALPQHETEALLEARLAALAPEALRRGVEVVGVREHDGVVEVAMRAVPDVAGAPPRAVHAPVVVGADGVRSTVRDAIGAGWHAERGRAEYVMADTADATGSPDLALLHFERAGVVESFPLPDGRRRWVALVRKPPAAFDPAALATIVRARLGTSVDPVSMTEPTAFTARQRIADRFAAGRIALVGDAAHEVSPIGGQGMNLGWLDALHLDRAIAAALRGSASSSERAGHEASDPFVDYARARRRAALRAMRQAAFNMAMGAPAAGARLRARNALVRLLAVPPVRGQLERAFTMRGL
ncbi:FAD-dependent monooxygenase [Agromyces protaetiae]|uniref:FAD-dependent monooxygenase n=1 Tax=Agromyces protaetiae TaxID=2509455 RepID=A0A4P6F9Y0_9MICO|nr:FAD-dependent monooxygenase [Agromyces protaetiae]QAY72742.1 FAD-dependent monooxygenase [Agromyces protaetiae]